MIRCRVGDLAITVNCEIPENLGRIVRVVSPVGFKNWQSMQDVFVWNVEAISDTSLMVYMTDGVVSRTDKGPVPDIFLRPIRGDTDHETLISEDDLTLSVNGS